MDKGTVGEVFLGGSGGAQKGPFWAPLGTPQKGPFLALFGPFWPFLAPPRLRPAEGLGGPIGPPQESITLLLHTLPT